MSHMNIKKCSDIVSRKIHNQIVENLEKELEQKKEWVKSHQKSVEIAFEKRNKALEELKNAKDHIKTLCDELDRGTQERNDLKKENERLKAELAKEISYPREKEEPLQGWTLSFDFLKSIQENIEEDGYGIDLEIIEQVMLAHEKLARQRQKERNESE